MALKWILSDFVPAQYFTHGQGRETGLELELRVSSLLYTIV